jgi:GNAT superfamily N-acetyltransferase
MGSRRARSSGGRSASFAFADHRGDALTLTLWLANKTADNIRRWIDAHHTLVAAEGALIVGVGMMRSTGEVVLNYVSPDARFRGVSKGIMAGLEASARDLGAASVTLQSSTTARRFYLSVGYREVGPPTKGFGLTLCHPMTKALHQGAMTGSDPSRSR